MKPKQADIQQVSFVVLKSFVDYLPVKGNIEPTNGLPIDIDFEIFKAEENNRVFRVALDISINKDNTHSGYKILLRTGSEYQYSDRIESDSDEYRQLMIFSALPCLINQTRLFLKTITSFFPMGEYVLPMFDMNDLLKQKGDKEIDTDSDKNDN